MRKWHRILLLATVVVATAASIAWALPSRAYSCECAVRPWNSRLIIQPGYEVRAIDVVQTAGRIASEAVLRDMLDGKPALLLGRRASAHHLTKCLSSAGYVSTRTTIHESAARLLHSLIPVSTSTLIAVLDSPLNRGPTPSAC